jgi:hypothetical protein
MGILKPLENVGEELDGPEIELSLAPLRHIVAENGT